VSSKKYKEVMKEGMMAASRTRGYNHIHAFSPHHPSSESTNVHSF